MDRKIVTIAEIGFALVFVMILSFIFYNIYGYSNDLNLDVETMQEVVNEADLAPYDNKTVSGDAVMSTINKMKEAKGGLSMSYGVCNGSTATASNWQFYGYGALKYASGEGNPAYYADGDEADNVYVTSPSSSYTTHDTSLLPNETGYISPVDTYTSQLVFNQNGVLVGMVFIK